MLSCPSFLSHPVRVLTAARHAVRARHSCVSSQSSRLLSTGTVPQQTTQPQAQQVNSKAAKAPSKFATEPPSSVLYSLALYRYPPAFFPTEMPKQRDQKTHPYLPAAPEKSERPPLVQGSKGGSIQSTDPDDARFLLLKVTKFAVGKPEVQSVVLHLDDTIGSFMTALSTAISSHGRVRGVSIDRGRIHSFFGRRWTELNEKQSVRHLLGRGAVHAHVELKPDFKMNQSEIIKQSEQRGIETSSVVQSSDSSSSSATISPFTLPSLVFNSSRPVRIGESGLVRSNFRFVALFCCTVLALGSHVYFTLSKDTSEYQHWMEERWNAKIKKEDVKRLMEAEQRAKARVEAHTQMELEQPPKQ